MVIFFLIILSVITIISILITSSSLKINVKEFVLINRDVEKLKVELSLNLFNKIKWLKLNLDNEKIKKMRNSARLKAFNKILDTKVLRKYIKFQDIIKSDYKQTLKEFNKVNIEKLELEAKISTKSIGTTAFLVAILSSVLGIILARKVNNPKFKIEPSYLDKNYIYLSINCIFAVNLVHIININKKVGRKEVYQKYGRTSNRRAYANSNG